MASAEKRTPFGHPEGDGAGGVAGGVDHLQIPPAAEVDPVPVEELLVDPDGAGHQVLEAGDGAVGELLANVLDPSLIGRVARHGAARRLLYGPGRPHVVGVGVGQDEPRDLLRAPARTPQVVEDDPLGGGDAAIDKGDLLAVYEVGVDEPRDGGAGGVSNLKGDLQGVDRGWDDHLLRRLNFYLLAIIFHDKPDTYRIPS